MASIKFKRGTAARWAEVNPILEDGQPGYVIGENKLKVGDGKTPWNELAYIGEDSVVNARTHYDFPSVGKPNTIYKAEEEKLVYQWNTTELKYEQLSTEGGEVLDINLINGGNANG